MNTPSMEAPSDTRQARQIQTSRRGETLEQRARRAARDRGRRATRKAAEKSRRQAARPSRQRLANEYAQQLIFVADRLAQDIDLKVPDHDLAVELQRELYALIDRVRVRGLQTPDTLRDLITRAMDDSRDFGCHTVEDIADETGLAEASVSAWLDGALAVGVVTRVPEGRPDVSRGAVDAWLWYLTGRGPTTDMVLP